MRTETGMSSCVDIDISKNNSWKPYLVSSFKIGNTDHNPTHTPPPTKFYVDNPGPGLGPAHQCGGVKHVNEILILR